MRSTLAFLPNRVIFHPVFIPLYILLVLFLIYWSSSLAWEEIFKHDESTLQARGRPFPWIGLGVIALGVGFVQYYEYNRRFDMKPYTRAQVAAKNTTDAVWLIVNGEVFDVTDFIKKHPPGSAIILKRAGTDVTRHYNYHLEATKHFWRQSKIGWIVQGDDAEEETAA